MPFDIEWQSTVAERYHSDMNDRARRLVDASAKVVVTDEYGGSDGVTADNGLSIEGLDDTEILVLAQQVANETKHPVTVFTEVAEPLATVQPQ